MSIQHSLFKIQRQKQREDNAFNGSIATVIIVVLMLVFFMMLASMARAEERFDKLQQISNESARKTDAELADREKELQENLIKAKRDVAEIKALSLSLPVEDVNRWTAGDTALQVLVLASLAVDRGQTAYLATHPIDGFREQHEVGWARHFIGDHPSSGQVNRYFATCGLLHTAVAIALPKEMKVGDEKIYPRAMWQSFWLGVEVTTIDRNISAGISFRFY